MRLKKTWIIEFDINMKFIKKYGFYILYYIQFTKNNTHIDRAVYQL